MQFYINPASKQRPDVPDHNRNKGGHISFLTYFGSTLSDVQLESGKAENIS